MTNRDAKAEKSQAPLTAIQRGVTSPKIVSELGFQDTYPTDQFIELLVNSADLTLFVGVDGHVKNCLLNQDLRPLRDMQAWAGRRLDEVLTTESYAKWIGRLDALAGDDADWARPIELNHIDDFQEELPVRYTIHPSPDAQILVLIGRDLRPMAEAQQRLVKAQIALERDYERYRVSEARYKAVMETAQDALIFVDLRNGHIADVNAAAVQFLRIERDDLLNQELTDVLEAAHPAEFLEELRTNAATGALKEFDHASTLGVRQIGIGSTLFRSGGQTMLVCRLESLETAQAEPETLNLALGGLYRQSADSIVFTDSRGTIRHANEAFLNLCDAPQLGSVKNRSLADFLARESVDLKVILENASRSGRLQMYSTKIRSVQGTDLSVEIAATRLGSQRDMSFGFIVRDVSRLEAVRETGVSFASESARDVMELVGSSPLKDIVAATTDVVEKICIEAAVDLTGNNRVAAAEMLGLSRQSLYVKLRKYDLLEK